MACNNQVIVGGTSSSYVGLSSKKYMELEEVRKGFDNFSINTLLKQYGYRNRPLPFEQAYLLGAFALAPFVEQLRSITNVPKETIIVQSIAALSTFHTRAVYQQEESEQQIAGICAAIFDYDIGTSQKGFLHPSAEVMDNCGMGGDLYRTPNLSTIAGIIAAADGINILKHGSPGNTDNIGSSDFLHHCGVNFFPSRTRVEEAIQHCHFGYTDALDQGYKRIHIQTHELAKIAHMNDIIGPITNPVSPQYMKKRVLGVNHLIPPERVAKAYRVLNEAGVTNVEHALVIRGFADATQNGGIDEVSLMPGGTLVAELCMGDIKVYSLFAQDFGFENMTPGELDPGTEKAECSRLILSGQIRDRRKDAAVANAAILFYLAQGLSIKEGVDKAEGLLDSGRPYETIREYANFVRNEKEA